MTDIINKIYYYYLGALPAIATFLLVSRLEEFGRGGMIFFVVGVALVGVYLTLVSRYNRPIKNAALLLFIFLSPPVLVLLTNFNFLEWSRVIVEIFFVENLAIWLAIGILTFTTDEEPTRSQIIAVIILALIVIAGLLGAYYFSGFFIKPWYMYWPLLLAVISTSIAKYQIIKKDESEKGEDDGMPFIIGNLFLWMMALFIAGAIVNN